MQNKILCNSETEMIEKIENYLSQYLKNGNTADRAKIEHLLSIRNQSKINNKIDKDCKFCLYAEEKENDRKERYLQATVCSLIGSDKGGVKHYQCFKTFLH